MAVEQVEVLVECDDCAEQERLEFPKVPLCFEMERALRDVGWAFEDGKHLCEFCKANE
jgi:hypothetical protein